MTYSGSSSNYDEEMKITERIQNSNLLIIDLDGTLINFEKIDNEIIKKIFGDNFIISMVDKILWKVNNLDLIANGYGRIKTKTCSIFTFWKENI